MINECEMQFIDFKYVTSTFFLGISPSESSVSSNIKCISTLFDLLQVQNRVKWCNSTKRCLTASWSFQVSTQNIPPRRALLPFSLPDSFPRCVVLGIPLSTYLGRVELLIRGSFTTPRHTFFPTISLVLEQRVFTLCVVYYLFAHLSTPCHSRRGNILGISLLLCSRLNSDPDAHITGA